MLRKTGLYCMHNTFRALCHIYSYLFKFATYPLRGSGGKSISGAKIDRRRPTIVRRTPSVSLNACQGLRQRFPFFPERCLSLSRSLSHSFSLFVSISVSFSLALYIHLSSMCGANIHVRPVNVRSVSQPSTHHCTCIAISLFLRYTVLILFLNSIYKVYKDYIMH